MAKSRSRAFTLVELLVVISIIAILAALTFPAYNMAMQKAHCAGCVSHMRALGIAFSTYASDHDSQLPGRVQGTGDKWPKLLLDYVSPDVYSDPGDPTATKTSLSNLASNTANNSSFFFNGFNDLGGYTNPSVTVGMANIATLGTPLLLLGQKIYGSDQFYMDFVEGNENDILNKKVYFGGSNYAFSDGSVQFMRPSQYSDTMWLMDKGYTIPTVPGH